MRVWVANIYCVVRRAMVMAIDGAGRARAAWSPSARATSVVVVAVLSVGGLAASVIGLRSNFEVAGGEVWPETPCRAFLCQPLDLRTASDDASMHVALGRQVGVGGQSAGRSAAPLPRGRDALMPPGADAPGPTTTTSTTSPGLRVAERNPPRITQLRAGGEVPDGPDEIFDDRACGSTAIPVEAVALDQSAIWSVSLHWSFAGGDGTVAGSSAMHFDGGKYRGVLGTFSPGTAPRGAAASIRWWVTAVDRYGNVGSADAPDGSGDLQEDERVRLVDCAV